MSRDYESNKYNALIILDWACEDFSFLGAFLSVSSAENRDLLFTSFQLC